MRPIDADALFHDMETADWYNNADRDEVAEPLVLRAPTIGGWISVKDRLPEMHKSIFAPWYGRKEWTEAMWQEESDRVIVAIKFPDGSTSVGTARLRDGKWSTDIVSRTLNPEITHWMPMPEPPKEVNNG